MDEGYFTSRQTFYQEIVDLVVRKIEGRVGRVCEFGCGCGQIIGLFKGYCDTIYAPNVSFGLDFSMSGILRAHEQYPDVFFFRHDLLMACHPVQMVGNDRDFTGFYI